MQYLEREARFVEIQRRADWLQEQLDSNSREKTELLRQAAQFQQLLLQKEHPFAILVHAAMYMSLVACKLISM